MIPEMYEDDDYEGFLLRSALGEPTRIPDPILLPRERLYVPQFGNQQQQSSGTGDALGGLGGVLGLGILSRQQGAGATSAPPATGPVGGGYGTSAAGTY